MKNKYDGVSITVSNNAECLAALYHLSKLTGFRINETSLNAALNNRSFYPYVKVFEDIIVRRECAEKSIPFDKMGDIDSYLTPRI